MSRWKQGHFSYGHTQRDLRAELLDYSTRNGYIAQQFADAVCTCGHREFAVQVDDAAGVAVRVCTTCHSAHPIGDSGEYLAEADLGTCTCPCGGSVFEVTVGVALYSQSDDVKWLYLGCRCVHCGLVACYGDWKNEFADYRQLLARV